jgi:16S rRNA processing protein RimM
MSNPEQELISIARILRPQGRKGEVLAELLTDQLDEFRAGRAVSLTKADKPAAQPVPAVLEDHWLPVGKNAGRIVLKLQGTDTISQAEMLAGQDVAIPLTELPQLDEDTFYVRDLVGCTLMDQGQDAGTVVDLQFAMSPDGRVRLEDAPPLLVVELSGSPEDFEPVLVPLALAYLDRVDVADKKIWMNLPAGLLEQPEDPEPSDRTLSE